MKKTNGNRNRARTLRIGLDFGKVIMGAVIDGKADTSFLGSTFADAMKSPASAGAFEGVTRLVTHFEGEAWIVSKCGQSVQNKTKGWLKHWNFYERTGLPRENVRFCLKRHQKAGICGQLGITHFVDDRIDVLEPMVGIVPRLYFFGELRPGNTCPPWARHAASWTALVETITAARQPEVHTETPAALTR